MSLEVITQLISLREQVAKWRQNGAKIGFVPTMGNLHAGHISLVKAAQQQCDKVIVSIFVNPLQFGQGEDFDCYPRTFKQDQKKLLEVQADAVFYPDVAQMYPNGQQAQTMVAVPETLTDIWEGAIRPGHFDGVTTVVMKLLNMVLPDIAVFGQKDFQQCAVIARMIDDLSVPVTLQVAPIVREPDGLALSSRNQYLDSYQRKIAPKLYQQLKIFIKALQAGETPLEQLIRDATQSLLVHGFDSVDYIQLCDAKTLQPIQSEQLSPTTSFKKHEFVLLAVARLGKTRLLDNILL